MPSLLIVARESKPLAELRGGLERSGFVCSSVPSVDEALRFLASQKADLLLVEVGGRPSDSAIWEFIRQARKERSVPVIALVAGELPDDAATFTDVDDFLASPYDAKELTFRVKRLLGKGSASGDIIKCDGLIIDLTNCDVTVRGKAVELTFKEYELLKLLAANRGRVYTRQDLLNKVWGYEYYGGDRTVDVHIRRLRSKIEGPGEIYIETVRNIGYRFKKEA